MVIFGCGVVTGGLLIKSQLPPVAVVDAPLHSSSSTNIAPPWSQIQRLEFLQRMERQLDLTPEQKDAITKIIRDSQERSKPLWAEIAPQMRQELRRTREEIRKVLTPDQQPKFDKLLKGRPRRAADNSVLQSPANAP
jgi:Spy/CpxP family protein refolding chaperone